MVAEIVKLANVTLPAASAVTLPAGWRRQLDAPIDGKPYRRRAVYAGSRGAIDTAYDAIRAKFRTAENLLSLAVQEDARSGVASVTVEYSSHVGSASGGYYPDDNDPVSEDTYQLEPVVIPTALRAHPAFATVFAVCEAIDDALLHGDTASAAAAAAAAGSAAKVTLANKYLGLAEAGVSQWEAVGYVWRVTRHYSTLADISGIAAAAAAIANANLVYAWSNVEGNEKIPEPKWTYTKSDDTVSDPQPFEWRLGGPLITRTSETFDITYTYTGAWKWAAALYYGGHWSPSAS